MKIQKLAGVLVGCALVFAACGDDSADSADGDESADTTAVEATDDETSGQPGASEEPEDQTAGEAVPQAIISLSPTATEMLYAIGAGDQVLAVDDFSNYPSEAAEKMQGISAFEPNVEAIAGLEPDLVITDGTNPGLLDQFDTLGIVHWEGPAAEGFDDVYTQIEQLGATTGHLAEAADLVAEMQGDIAEVRDGLPALDEPLTYYHELDDTYFSVSSDTFIGAVYDEIGLVNIADTSDIDSPYPQLNAEFIIEQNPDLIYLACVKYCGISAESVAARPGWDQLDAVKNGGVIEMDDDVASRWGPRIVEYLEIAGMAVAETAAVRTSG